MFNEAQDHVVQLCQGEPHEHGGHGKPQPCLEIYWVLA